jgi:hypothetical protein
LKKCSDDSFSVGKMLGGVLRAMSSDSVRLPTRFFSSFFKIQYQLPRIITKK